MSDFDDFNRQIIDEFRSNDGVVGGPFEGATLLLLHTTGAKSGQERVVPLVYRPVGDDIAIFGSKGGAPTHPDWYHNVLADPAVRVELGTEVFGARARVLEGDERETIWTDQKRDVPGFADYEAQTTRQIPVVVLERT
jgi:deazaflavin-dependent oxidoreductase (nitroreductase family)